MQRSGVINVINFVGEWMIKLVYANLLWMLFTLLGLGIFGIMPATVSLFTLIRKWITGNEEQTTFRIFWNTYRQEFIKANLFGIIFLTIGIFLRFEIIFFQMSSSNLLFQIFHAIMICISLLYFITLLNFFPVYVHFKLKFFQYLKFSLLIGLSQLSSTLVIIFTTTILLCIYWYISGLIPLLATSLLALNIMWFSHQTFKKL
ncbi:YesL family protein [Metabacillus malikii]|uniref:Membrane protein YesL n=1 Tax=Metabacillus malikii TaxID=1504265 RepID=A0ABT9ZDK8_9BACI|nr:putative membrane protein YesL [Metabacillus malikii]